MAGRIKGLTRAIIKQAKPREGVSSYKLGDGGGLYLNITAKDARSWLFRYKSPLTGKEREMGLGSLDALDLDAARAMADDYRRAVKQGIDPIAERKAVTTEPTFLECMDAYLYGPKGKPAIGKQKPAGKSAEWSNPKHAMQWRQSVLTHAESLLARKVSSIGLDDVLAVLRPIWGEKAETARRVRARIEAVLGYATVKEYRAGDNPARWTANLALILPLRNRKNDPIKHFKALAVDDLPDFMAKLRSREAMSALLLEFTILTATRSKEARHARFDEFDLDAALWTIPAARMKAGKEHIVPLSGDALAIVRKLASAGLSDYVFCNASTRKPLSENVTRALLLRMGLDVTTHGYRSVYRDWAGDKTNFPREVIERSLAHTIKNKSEAAYRRTTAIEKRRDLMELWARYCSGKSGATVVKLRG